MRIFQQLDVLGREGGGVIYFDKLIGGGAKMLRQPEI